MGPDVLSTFSREAMAFSSISYEQDKSMLAVFDRVILEEAMMAFEDYRIPGKIKGKVMLKF